MSRSFILSFNLPLQSWTGTFCHDDPCHSQEKIFCMSLMHSASNMISNFPKSDLYFSIDSAQAKSILLTCYSLAICAVLGKKGQ